MFCPHCSAQVPDGNKFCQNCGAPMPQPAPAPEPQPAPQPTPEQPPQFQSMPPYTAGFVPPVYIPTPVTTVNTTSVLVFGILSLALAYFSMTFVYSALLYIEIFTPVIVGSMFGIPALIFGILAVKRAGQHRQEGGLMTGKVKAGKIIGLIGLIISAIALAVAFFCFIIILMDM